MPTHYDWLHERGFGVGGLEVVAWALALGGALGCGAPAPGAATAAGGAVPPPAAVRPGIEVLLDDSLHLVRGRRVGILTNQTGVDRAGTSDVDRLRAAGVEVVAIFSPEHGFRGTADPGAAVASSVDSVTGLPIYSLYGGEGQREAADAIRRLGVLLVDLQDAGARYYTYITTTAYVLGVAGPAGVPVVILDRPNPLGGVIQGNVLDSTHYSSVGFLRVAMRHGMTLGELALQAAAERGYHARLSVVPLDGWRRSMAYDATGLPFVPPSPNLRSLEALFHYPGLCLFEGTDLSVGRGSEAPFEQIGAPWLDTAAVLATVRAARLPGVAFRGVGFTPRRPGDGKHPDRPLAGIRLAVTDRASYDPTATAVHLLVAIHRRHPDAIGFDARRFDRLAGGSALREAVLAGVPAERIVAGWAGELAEFRSRRAGYLIYPD